MRRLAHLLLFGSMALQLVAQSALAVGIPQNYGDFVGTDTIYRDVTETTQTAGDPDVMWGAPTLVGDQLLFFPTAFSATAAGAAGADSTLSLLSTQIESKPNRTIDAIQLTEFGDTTLSGSGTDVTRTAISMSGFVTVTEDINGLIVPVVIPFSGTYVPKNNFDLVGDPGTTLWSGTFLIDVASYWENATVATLSFNNQLDAFSETSSSASIQKKVVSGPAVLISVIPEPGTALLLGAGLAALGMRRSASRRA